MPETLSSDGRFFFQFSDAQLTQSLTPEELALYRSLNVDARIVVTHRLRIGDSFERAKRQLHVLADEAGLYEERAVAL